ncbi:MAG: hypothetical protein P4L90_22790 [Rhodopila sp.]|nr:hypothetical protein [Rhodopila sp.]
MKWRHLSGLLAITAVLFASSPDAWAEYCWMIGCVGRVGYVYLPSPQYPPDAHGHYQLDGHECAAPEIEQPFHEGFPDVNTVATVASQGTQLLTQDDIERHLGSFQGPSIEQTDNGGCRGVWRPPADLSGDPMKTGAKVKILGYRTFINQIGRAGRHDSIATSHEQILFALVLVETDL